jgi:hypothetical protein
VQTLDRRLSMATRPSHCPHATCPGALLRVHSAAALRLAPPGSTYGYDVRVHMAGCGSTNVPPTVRFPPRSPHDFPSPKPMCALSLSTTIDPSWPATSGSSAGAWPRSLRSMAA